MTSLLVILSLVAAAPNDPAAATAVNVLTCDFEEAADRDYDGWPDGWMRQHSRDLPEFLKIGIVPETFGGSPAAATSSPGTKAVNHCLLIELNGGGAIVSSPVCPISSQFSLALSLRLKTEGLKHDGAWVDEPVTYELRAAPTGHFAGTRNGVAIDFAPTEIRGPDCSHEPPMP